jgi:hypothetical protein
VLPQHQEMPVKELPMPPITLKIGVVISLRPKPHNQLPKMETLTPTERLDTML